MVKVILHYVTSLKRDVTFIGKILLDITADILSRPSFINQLFMKGFSTVPVVLKKKRMKSSNL